MATCAIKAADCRQPQQETLALRSCLFTLQPRTRNSGASDPTLLFCKRGVAANVDLVTRPRSTAQSWPLHRRVVAARTGRLAKKVAEDQSSDHDVRGVEHLEGEESVHL